MRRRGILGGAALLAAAAATGAARAQGHAGHHQHGAAGGVHPLVAATLACQAAGIACLDHCYEALAAGDTSLAACARAVDQMLAATAALARLAGTGSPHVPAFAKACLAVCLDCEKECRKHADRHATCKACAEACAACAAECRKVAA